MVKQTNKKDLYQKCGILEARVGIYKLQLKINFRTLSGTNKEFRLTLLCRMA